MLKWCVVVLTIFARVTRLKADAYSLYNISQVPPLCGICGLTQEQVTAAEQHSNKCSGDNVQEVCTSFDCIEKQQDLVDCLTYQEVSNRRLEHQVGLDVNTLLIQVTSATEGKERAVSVLLDVIKLLNKALGHYYEMVRAYEATVRERAKARDSVQEKLACVEKISRELCRAKARLKANQRRDAMVPFKNQFGMHVTGCKCTDCPIDGGGDTCCTESKSRL